MAGVAVTLPLMPGLSYQTPLSDPGTQTGWDTFSPPITSTPNGPIISDATRKAAANQLVHLTGNGFTSTTFFAFYSQTTANNRTLIKDTSGSKTLLRDTTNNLASVVLPNTLPAGAVLIWPCDGSTLGRPVILNTAQCWHALDATTGLKASAVISGTINVYGENLVNGSGKTWVVVEVLNGTYGKVVLTNYSGGTGIVSANEDRVQFTMPSSVGNHGTVNVGDTIQIWVHSGRGGYLGWGNVPYTMAAATIASLNLDYTAGAQYTMPAATNSATDNTNFTTALAAMTSTSGTITFLSGTYRLNSRLINGPSAAGVLLKGAGISSTTIKPVTSGYSDAGSAGWLCFSGKGKIQDMTIDATDGATVIGTNGAVLCPYADNVTVISPLITTNGGVTPPAISPSGNPGVYKNSTIKGCPSIGDSAGNQLIFDTLSLVQMDGGADASIFFDALQYADISTITVTQNVGASTRGRIIAVLGKCQNYYLASITSTLTPIVNDNGGEQIFIGESGPPGFRTGVTSDSTGATTKLTFGSAPSVNWLVQIPSGKGLGQWGVIRSVNGNIGTLDRLWSVDLDGTSTVMVSSAGTVYGCVRDCSITGGGIVTGSASCGWQFYQPAAKNNFRNNSVTSCNYGYQSWSLGDPNANTGAVNMWAVIENTTLLNCGWNERWRVIYADFGLAPWPVDIGVLVRGTTATAPSGTITTNNIYLNRPLTNLLGHDNCSFTDAPSGYYPSTNEGRDVWWNSALTPGHATGTTNGIDPASGNTGTNLILRGTGGITGFTANNKAATP